MGICVAACSGMLDIPDDPYLAQPAPTAIDGGVPPSPVPGAGSTPAQSGVETEPGSEVGGGNVQGNVQGNAGGDPPGPMTSSGDTDVPPPVDAADAGALLPPPDAAPAPTCPANATLGADERCYAIVASPLTWVEARAACQSLGAGWDLAAIANAAENELVANLTGDEAWLGGSDAELEGSWIWIEDGAPFWSGDGATGAAVDGAFESWNSDEPNGGGPSDCLRLVAGLGTWADLQCTFERPAVCEGPTR